MSFLRDLRDSISLGQLIEMSASSRFKLLVRNAKQVAVVCRGCQLVLPGKEMGHVAVMPESSSLDTDEAGVVPDGVSIVVNL